MYCCIDLWDKRCWIAIMIGWIVLPKAIVSRVSIISVLRKYIQEYSIEHIIVGLPYDLHGKNMRQLDKTRAFIDKLIAIFPGIHIEWHDERFTSFEADQVSRKLSKHAEKRDDISAVIILESYLKHNNS